MPKVRPLFRCCIAICLLIFGVSVGYAQQRSAIDKEHTKWIDDVMREIQTIKPGMTRDDLQKLFVEEGGRSTRMHRKYVYKSCPYIKVDIDFVPSDEDKWAEKPEDKIAGISHPYLESTISD